MYSSCANNGLCTYNHRRSYIHFVNVVYKDNALYTQQKQLFETEISQHSQVLKVYPNNDQMEDSLQFIELYPINTTDALILQCALDKAKELRTRDHDLILVSSDNDFLKAARSEGLVTFNPERNKRTYLDNLNA